MSKENDSFEQFINKTIASFKQFSTDLLNNKPLKSWLLEVLVFIFIVGLIMFLSIYLVIPSLSGILLTLYIVFIIAIILYGCISSILKLFEIASSITISLTMFTYIYGALFVCLMLGLGLYLSSTYVLPLVSGITLVLFLFVLFFVYSSILIYLIVKFYEIVMNEKYPLGKYFTNWFLFLLAGCGIIALIFGGIYVGSFLSSHLMILKILIVAVFILIISAILKKIPGLSKVTDLIINIVLYIPCLVNSLLEGIMGNFTNIFLIVLEIVLILLYLFYPKIQSYLYLKDAIQLINKPVKLYEVNSLGTTAQLNGSDDTNYTYALSFWFYLDAVPPSINNSYTQEGNILHLGKTPTIRYKSMNNQIIISVANINPELPVDRVISKIPNIQLQKWNQIIINNTGGTMDIFYNGKLFESAIEVVPYQTYDILEVGQDNGISGGLGNLIYYRHALDIYKIRHLYNSFKHKDPPSLSYPNKTIIPFS